MRHNSRNGDAERPVTDDVGEAVHDFSDNLCDILWCRPLRCGDAKSLRSELASRKIDGCSFDAAASGVDAEHGRASYRFFAHAGEPSDIQPLRGGLILAATRRYSEGAARSQTRITSSSRSDRDPNSH